MSPNTLLPIIQQISDIPRYKVCGSVTAVKGLLIECEGLEHFLSIGSRCLIHNRVGPPLLTEVVGFKHHVALLMPFGNTEGIGVGCTVEFVSAKNEVYPDHSWLGRVINFQAEPLDGKGLLIKGVKPYSLNHTPPPAYQRKRVEDKIDLGVKAVNCFVSCCYGQRMGIFAGSGVGKSVLISMFTKHAAADVKIIGLVGERGREVQEFLDVYLGEEGLRNAIVIVATSDEPALVRRQAAQLTMSIAEYFRDLGKNVLCIIDNITRFAMAQREIGLASGEPPTMKAYTPTVFSELPRLLERAGPGANGVGSITGLFAVLVDGDDHNEPIADAVRGILDGHIVLERSIAERGRFPAVDVLKSLSRTMPGCNTKEENEIVNKARKLFADYNEMADMIKIGAYKRGSNPEIDLAITLVPKIEAFLKQLPDESTNLSEGYAKLASIVNEV